MFYFSSTFYILPINATKGNELFILSRASEPTIIKIYHKVRTKSLKLTKMESYFFFLTSAHWACHVIGGTFRRLSIQLFAFFEPTHYTSSICSLTVNNTLFFQTLLTPTELPVPGNPRAAAPDRLPLRDRSVSESGCLWAYGTEAAWRGGEGPGWDASRNQADRMLGRPR